MSTKLYAVLIGILITGAILGSWLAISEGEDWISVLERLVRFSPAVLVFTFMWKRRRSKCLRSLH